MFCKKCGSKINDDAKFCQNCGSPVETENVINENAPKPFIDNRTFENPEGNVPQGDPTVENYYAINKNSNKDTYAILSFVLSLVSIPLMFLCCIGFLTLIASIILGFFGLSSNKRGFAIAGCINCFIYNFIFLWRRFIIIKLDTRYFWWFWKFHRAVNINKL